MAIAFQKNTIIISVQPKGRQFEGIINDTSKPGTLMQVDTSVTPLGGRFGWKANAPGTDGRKGLVAVLLEDRLQGKTPADAFVAGTMGKLYFPQPGDELNLRVGEVAGTGNTISLFDRLAVDAEDGLLVPTSGTAAECCAHAMEAETQVAGGALLACWWVGM